MTLLGIVRTLSFLIDIIIVYFPSVVLLQLVFNMNIQTADLFAQILYLLYAVIIGNSTKGKSLGKMFSKQRVIYYNHKPDLVYVGLRELPKMLYFLPHFGFIFVLLTIVLFFWKGTTLHDLIGGSEVISDYMYEELSSNG